MALDCWLLKLPGHSIMWDYYVLTGCSLSDKEGVSPARKLFADATHEVVVGAVENKPQEELEAGKFVLLQPINHFLQVISTDSVMEKVLEELAQMFIENKQLPESSGITGARELFNKTVLQLNERFLQS